MPNLGIDIDGVLIDFFSSIRKVYPSIPKNIEFFNLEFYLTEKEKKELNETLQLPTFYSFCLPYPRALEFIREVKELFGKIYVITARTPLVRSVTESTVKKLELDSKNLILHKQKARVVPGLDLTCMIEDSPEQLEELKYFVPLIVPIRSWNKEWIKRNIGGFPVYPYNTYSEALEYIKKLLNKEEDNEKENGKKTRKSS